MSEQIHGWFDFEGLYSDAVESAPDSSFLVEVGVWQGKSLVFLADRVVQSGKSIRVVGVDTFQGDETLGEEGCGIVRSHDYGYIWRQCSSNIIKRGLGNVASLITGPSSYGGLFFQPECCWLVFIDASHTYHNVTIDLETWWPKVCPGGWLAGHDYSSGSVHTSVHEFADRNNLTVEGVGSCWRIVKGARL